MIEPHKHCPACGTPMPMSEKYCSPRCQQIIAENQRKVKRTNFYRTFLAAIHARQPLPGFPKTFLMYLETFLQSK